MPAGSTGGKKVTGRKRQLLVDTAGNLLAVQVQPAGIADGPGARGVLTQALRLVPTVRKLWADSAYNAEALSAWLAEHWPQLDLEIVRRAEGTTGFAVQPRRWVVERSFAWLGLNRLLSKENERLPWHEEGWILLASISLLLNR
jgi:putative transposase